MAGPKAWPAYRPGMAPGHVERICMCMSPTLVMQAEASELLEGASVFVWCAATRSPVQLYAADCHTPG